MSKKVIQVSADATRQMNQEIDGSFYSAHKQEDIEKWLSYKDADTDDESFEELFGGYWYEDCSDGLENYNVKFQEREVEDKLLNSIKTLDDHYCQFDDEIQEFLDEEPQRKRLSGIRRINYQFTDLMGNVQGMKETALQLLNDFKKVVKTDDVEKLPEEEQKIYQTLKDLISP